MHGVQIFRLSDHLARESSGFFKQDRDRFADHRVLDFALLFGDQRLQPFQTVVFDVFGELWALGGWCAGTGGILEAVGIAVFDLFDQIHGRLEICFAFLGEANNEIARQKQIGACCAQPFDQANVALCRVRPIHPLQDMVAARLHGKVQIRHEFGTGAMRFDQVVTHVVGMAGGKPDSFQAIDVVQRPDQACKRPVRTIWPASVIGVHVLTKQSDFPHAPFDQITRLVKHAPSRPADLCSACIGHHAKGTELVTALLHGQECRRTAFGLWAFFQVIELVLFGELGVERLFPVARLCFKLRQAVVALRANDQIDQRLPAHDLFAFGLSDAAGDANLQIGVLCLEGLVPTEFRVDLFRSFLADVAGVQQDHVGVVSGFRFDVALTSQGLCHALRVVDVHLAPIGFDKQFLWLGHGLTFWCNGSEAVNSPKLVRLAMDGILPDGACEGHSEAQMTYPSLNAFLTRGRAALGNGPIALIFAEDDVEICTTIRHHRQSGFAQIVLFARRDLALPAEVSEQVIRVDYDLTQDRAVPRAVNGVIEIAEGRWLFYCFNAEYLFFPFCETRSISEMLAFHSEERRDAMLTYVVDLYASDLNRVPLAVDLEDAWLDRSGYYAAARVDPVNHGHPKERQLDFFGGLRWRFEEHVPKDRRRIDRIALFRAKPGLTLREDHTFNVEEYNTYACPWHNNLTGALASFRTAKALKINPGSSFDIQNFKWQNSVPFDWSSRQLLDLGLIDAGQWF